MRFCRGCCRVVCAVALFVCGLSSRGREFATRLGRLLRAALPASKVLGLSTCLVVRATVAVKRNENFGKLRAGYLFPEVRAECHQSRGS